MSLSLDDVRRIAFLSRIDITPTEVEHTRDQLNDILGFVAQLQAVDTQGVTPMSHAVDVVQRLREDCVTETDQREHFQRNAPETAHGQYLVPRVID